MGVDVVGGWTCGLSILELRHVTEKFSLLLDIQWSPGARSQ